MRVYQRPLGAKFNQFCARPRSLSNGDLPHVGMSFRAATVLLLDHCRFHLSTQAYQLRQRRKLFDSRWLEQHILPLGLRLVLVTRSPASFQAAKAERLKVSTTPCRPSNAPNRHEFCRAFMLFGAWADFRAPRWPASSRYIVCPTLSICSGSDWVSRLGF